ncbi:MAG TPA: SPOR domain-containing protein [Rhodopila sp.]|nr:SPOR domain-containing protein [Rhodopila sp.]
MSDDLSIPNPDYRGSRAGRYGAGRSRPSQAMDPDTRRLMLFAGGLGAVLVALVGASTLMGRHSTGVPVVAADPNPIRVKPTNPGGMKIDGAENDVFSGGSDTANAQLAPAAESPDTKALRAESAPPAATPPATVAPSAAADAAAPPPETHPARTAAEHSARPAQPAVARTQPAAETPNRTQEQAADARSPASAHPAMVQLAALTSEEAARNEWEKLARRMPDLLNGRRPMFSHTEHDGHTFWRLRTAGFADIAQARAFCERVRQKGGGCSVADF